MPPAQLAKHACLSAKPQMHSSMGMWSTSAAPHARAGGRFGSTLPTQVARWPCISMSATRLFLPHLHGLHMFAQIIQITSALLTRKALALCLPPATCEDCVM